MKAYILCGLLLCCSACVSSDRAEDGLVGRWEMKQVLESGEDVTAEHNPEGNRWITLTADSSFVSDGDPYGRNTGRWTFDHAAGELYLDSDAGEGDDSYWIVTVDGDMMRWEGTRSPFTERFVLIHTRATAALEAR